MKNILMVIPPERFRDEELFETKQELEKSDNRILFASTHKGKCTGSRGGYVFADIDISEVDTNEYDAVIYIGGGGSKLLFYNESAVRIAREMNTQGKIVAAICLAPVILANAGILEGKRATVAGTEAGTIENKGAKYTGPGVTLDDNIVTANAPKKSRLFGQTIRELLNRT
jgi:protease I